jgi:uncharacterized protein (DUF2062 family)
MIAPLRRTLDAVVALLKQGITPEKIAQAVALAVVLSVFPILGSTTLLCAGAAAILRLNLPLMQLVNWLMYPVQLLLLIPLMSFGSRLFGLLAVPPLGELMRLLAADPWHTLRLFWPAGLSAVGAWLVVSPFAAALVYALLIFPLRRLRLAPQEAA